MSKGIMTAVLLLVLGEGVAHAADEDTRSTTQPSAQGVAMADDFWRPVAALAVESTAKRSGWVPALSVSIATTNALDWYSTVKALDRGYREGNPFMAPFVKRPFLFATVKASAAAFEIYAASSLWKEHRAAAVMVFVAATAASGFAAGQNAMLVSRSSK